MVDNRQVERLMVKAIAGEISEDEQQILDSWIMQSPENEKEFDAYKSLWEKSNRLILSNEIDLESSLIQTKKRITGFQTKKRWITYFKQVAAILVISISVSGLYNYFSNDYKLSANEESVVVQEVRAAYGTSTKLQLADGTLVWLNSGSTLRFPISFNNMDERRVELNGEGYFEVTKNEKKPFIVNTSELDVKVYGTSFNVNAYKDFSSTTVALVEGKVSLIKEYSSGPKELIVLAPNDVVKYDMNSKTLLQSTDLNMSKYTAWKEGYIVFFGDSIDRVVQRLEKWYNVDIEINDKALYEYQFTATFANESLEQVLYLLSLSSPIQYKITPAKRLKDNTFSMRKVTFTINN